MIQEIDLRVRALTLSFIEDRYPDEVSIFPIVWNRFESWKKESGNQPASSLVSEGLGFAAPSREGTIVSPFALLIVDAVMHELNLRDVKPQLSNIKPAIEALCLGLKIEKVLAAELSEHLGPRLAEMFDTSGSQSEDHSPTSKPPLEKKRGELPSTDCWVSWLRFDGSTSKPITPQMQAVKRTSAISDFVEKRFQFDLFVNELGAEPCIELRFERPRRKRKKLDEVPNLWRKLSRKQRVLLGHILRSLETQEHISKGDIAATALGGRAKHEDLREPLAKLKFITNVKLSGLLDEIVHVPRGGDFWEVYPKISFCWIRPNGIDSFLFKY